MSVIATAVKHMLAAGLPHDQIVSAVAEMEASLPRAETPEERRKRVSRETSERWRAKKRDAETSPNVTSRHQEPVTSGDEKTSPVTEKRHRVSPPRARVEDNLFPVEPEESSEANASSDSRPSRDLKAEFAAFWSAYPRKTKKADAARAFPRAAKDTPLQVMLAALDRQREAWAQDHPRFIPHPTTWLNGRRWEDEPPATVVHLHERTGPADRRQAAFVERHQDIAAAMDAAVVGSSSGGLRG